MKKKNEYADLIDDLKAMVKEEKGQHTGRFEDQIYTVPAAPKEVKDARKKVGLSQSQFALALGVSLNTVQSWEYGSRRPESVATKAIRLIKRDPSFLKVFAKA
jgi:DNA-binding transcriptional regulator YiaG